MTDLQSTRSLPVLFVGAGPGDPELITLRGARALAGTDVVVWRARWFIRRCWTIVVPEPDL